MSYNVKSKEKGILPFMAIEKDWVSIIQKWWLAARPKTLPAAISPVLVGSGVAFSTGHFRLAPALVALFASIMIQIGTNLVNDVVDFLHGADNTDRLGPMRVTQAGLLTPRQVWTGAFISFGLATLAGIYLVILGGIPILLVGVVCIFLGIIYSAGPFPLTKNGLGDIFAFLAFGLTGVCGTAYVIAGFLPPSAWTCGVGVGALVTAILIVNNIRDIETDRRAGRRNIPVIFGRKGGEIEYAMMIGIAFLAPVILVFFNRSTPWVFICWIALPLAITLLRKITISEIGPGFNKILANTAQLLLFYSLLLSIGFAIGTF
jgi:1,4-dihydroxy-2-naphthoate octaprenyltransferase